MKKLKRKRGLIYLVECAEHGRTHLMQMSYVRARRYAAATGVRIFAGRFLP